MRVSAAIMAHPKRAASVERLQRMLDRDVPVVWDERNDRWDTGRRSLLAYDKSADYHLVVQDDCLPAADLCAALERWIPTLARPGATCLYAGNIGRFRRVLSAAEPTPPCWLQMKRIQWGVALVLPTSLIESAVRHGDSARVTNYDMRLSLWAQSLGLPVYYPYPSWVDHDPGPSLIGGHGHDRQALLALRPGRSALTDFDAGSPPHIVQVSDFARPGDGAPPSTKRPRQALYSMKAAPRRR